ncbi:hypothetical protein EVAR_77726_1 [Eumeta japonica]|uniref:Uncharacterized protein n=1 Tax=Eumeta variegata TaxID=151549 RepID=A0A4C1TAP9_EUMVA|nr:hypothetical protein EVAR_77726_1 [Eumeta japonica]
MPQVRTALGRVVAYGVLGDVVSAAIQSGRVTCVVLYALLDAQCEGNDAWWVASSRNERQHASATPALAGHW